MERRIIIVKPRKQDASATSNILKRTYDKINIRQHQYNRHHGTKLKSLPNPNVFAEVGIQGMNKIFNRQYNAVGKFIWAVAILACFVVCVIQISARIRHYISVPYSLAVDLERERTTQFPAVLICPFYPFIYGKEVWKYLNVYYNNHREKPWDSLNFLSLLDETNLTVSEIWNFGYVMHETRAIVCQLLSTRKNCDLHVTVEHYTTYIGICAKYQLSDKIKFDGPYNGIRLQFKDSINDFGVGMHYMAIIHHPDDDYKHLLYHNGGIYLQENSWIQIKILIKKYFRHNTPSRSCGTRLDVQQCKTECAEHNIATNMSCRLPYMKESTALPLCNTSEEAKRTYNHTLHIYETMDVLCGHCPKPCIEYIYTKVDTIMRKLENVTRVTVLYHDNIAEIVKEMPAYTFSVLIADVGGSLGLFLGICLLSVLQIAEALFVAVKKRLLST